MALPRSQQRLLDAIDQRTSSADPRLAWLFGTFSRLWADEPLPARERLRTRAGRLWAGLWEALATATWPAPSFTDEPGADAAGGAGPGTGPISAVPGQAQQPPDETGQNGQADGRYTS